MDGSELDDVDRAILYALQENARHVSNAEISEGIGLSASTVGKRIAELEAVGVITGYRPEIDYERAGFPLEVLFICTAPLTDRERLVESAANIPGIVHIRELMTGDGNVHILVAGTSKGDVSRIAHGLDELGFDVRDEILVGDEDTLQGSHFDGKGPRS